MPTILAHPFVSLALGPSFRRVGVPASALFVGAVCCVIPDLDVVGFKFGIPYQSTFGHRGFTHSLCFAVLIAGLFATGHRIAQGEKTRPWPLFMFYLLCAASHPLLDALTNGGLGVALFSPFSNERYFFPWRPIEVSPIGASRFLAGHVHTIFLSEIEWVVCPCLAIWLLTRRNQAVRI